MKEKSKKNETITKNTALIFDKTIVYIAVLAVIFIAGIFLRVSFLNVDFRSSADEGFYLKYAAYIAKEPGASLTKLVDEYLRHEDWQLFPNPLRAGQIIISAWWMKMLRLYDFKALVYMSAFFSILSLFVGYFFARRLFDKRIAMMSLILFAASPINLALSRRALQDSLVYFLMILTVYLFYLALKKENIILNILFSISFFITIMVKESSVLLISFFVFFLFWEKTFFNRKLKIIPILFSFVAVTIATFLAYFYITGGTEKLVAMAKIILASPMTNEYAIKYQSGSLLRYAYDFFLVSPITLVAAAGFFALYFAKERLQNESGAYLVTFFIMFYIIYSFFSKNIRYVMALDLPVRIFAVLFISELCVRLKERGLAGALAVVSLIGIIDLFIFRHIFLSHAVYDPVTYILLSAWKG